MESIIGKITMPDKIIITIAFCIFIGYIGGRLFVRFIYNIFLRYFDSIEEVSKANKDDIKELYRRTDNHEEVKHLVEYCNSRNKKR